MILKMGQSAGPHTRRPKAHKYLRPKSATFTDHESRSTDHDYHTYLSPLPIKI